MDTTEGQLLREIVHEMRHRYATGDGQPSPDMISQHSYDVAQSLTRWADEIEWIIPPVIDPQQRAANLKKLSELINELYPVRKGGDPVSSSIQCPVINRLRTDSPRSR